MARWGTGRLLIALVAVITMISPTLVDFNESHIFNPNWSGHAKFHVAHTMLLGAVLGAVSLTYLYAARHRGLPALRAGAWFAAVYWIAQSGAILVPGTAFADPEGIDQLPVIAGFTVNQPVLDFMLVSIVVGGYALEARRLRGRSDLDRTSSDPPTVADAGAGR